MVKDHPRSSTAAAEQKEALRADGSATRGVESSPGGAEYVSWTFHHRIRNQQRGLPWYIVGIQVWTHRISEKIARSTQSDEGGKRVIGDESKDTKARTILRLRHDRQAVPLWRGYAPWECR